MEHIHLSVIHKRAVWAALLVVEKRIDELSQLLNHIPNQNIYCVENDLSAEQLDTAKTALANAKIFIAELAEKYQLRKDTTQLSHVTQTTQYQIWEALSDTITKLKRSYGDFTEDEHPEELKADLNKLIGITEKITSA
ncbi:MAG: hypothetical protein KIS94_12805 [Chitinophagales bacterium]|nr:hypothetical protein [Chitinophagales bacterium]